MILEAGKSQIYRVGQQAGDPEKSQCCNSSPKASTDRIPSYSETGTGSGQSLFYERPSADLMRSSHIMEGTVPHSKPTDLNINVNQKHPHRNIQNNV